MARFTEMEKQCQNAIKTAETTAKEEMDNLRSVEESISNLQTQGDIEEAQKKILQKNIYDRAREKHKEKGKRGAEESETAENPMTDQLTPVLEKYRMTGRDLTQAEAWKVKQEIMDKTKERLLARADIIQQRLEEEKANQKRIDLELSRRRESMLPEETRKLEEEMAQTQFKITILVTRAFKHEEMALEKFTRLDKELMNHPILAKGLQYYEEQKRAADKK